MSQIVFSPYVVGPPILEPKKFFGRQRELREVFSQLANLSSVSIVGERRIGKTSLLHQIANIYSEWLPTPNEFKVIFLDLQNVTSVERFCRLVSSALGSKQSDHEEFTITALADAIAESNKKIVLCLDEFENSVHHEFGEEFFDTLRSLASSGKMALVVATRIPLNELYRQKEEDITSSFHNIFWQVRLDEFTQQEAKDFIARPYDGEFCFSQNDAELIHKLAGNHPLKLNLACSLAAAKSSGESVAEKLKAEFQHKLANQLPVNGDKKEAGSQKYLSLNSPTKWIARKGLALQLSVVFSVLTLILGLSGEGAATPVGLILIAILAFLSLAFWVATWIGSPGIRGRSEL